MTALQTLEQPKPNIPDASEFGVMKETATMLVKTGFLPQAIKTPEQAIAIILTGRELGIGTMAALNTINVIQGKPTVSPQLMLALIERSGQLENIEITNGANGAICDMKRRGRAVHREIFGPNEAKAMGLDGKDNYKKQAAVMYRWRAVAACARVVFPDVILGLYTPDEMGADVDADGEVIAMPKPTVAYPPSKGELIEAARQQEPPATYDEAVLEATAPTPEQQFAAKQAAVADLCRALNKAGDSIKWTAKTLNEYVNELFEVEDGTDALSIGSYDALIADLTVRLNEVSGGK